MYPEADFRFSFEAGGTLQLFIKEERILLEFETSKLPLGKYISEGYPIKNDSSLCDSKIVDILLA